MIQTVTTLSTRTQARMYDVLRGGRSGLLGGLAFVGPAVVASIAYIDPGNYATNIQAGARYGYSLLWVVVLANGVAMLFQALSAKLGIVTGRNLAEHCRDTYSKRANVAMWLASEVAAMATDLAEFIGGAIGLSLCFHIPLLAGMVAVAIATYGVLLAGSRGFRPVELIIGALIATIAICFLVELFVAPVGWTAAAFHSVVPQIPDAGALTISVGIIGATVMPHAIFLHSGLTQDRGRPRNDDERRILVRFSNREVMAALCVAGAINMAMVIMASSVFYPAHRDVAEIATAYHMLTPLLGGAAATVFLISLIASGLSSSVVGTMAGQMIMQGFVGISIPVWLRRAVTVIPAFVVVAAGVEPTRALVLSQVVLSFALPIPMIALVRQTRRAEVMRSFVNGRLTDVAAVIATAAVLALNLVLLLQTFGVAIPGLAAD